LLNLYNLRQFKEGYKFVNNSGDEYYAYFTPFTLKYSENETIETVSFGFECKRHDSSKRQVYDEYTKLTIVHVINEYFNKNGDNALLYICLNIDGKARHRNITFNKWFRELGQEYERYKSKTETEQLNFFSSILIKKDNQQKEKFTKAFEFTIDFWFPNN
jgi:hypothetical protein